MKNILSIQMQPKIGDRDANLGKVAEIAAANADKNPDLIILSEFFNTGVSKPAFERLAEEEENSPTKAFCAELAKKYDTYVLCGSIVEKDGDKLYNTARLLDRNGKMIAKYRKINLFKYFGGTEDEYISPGNETVVVDTELGKIGFCTCFDISYPMHFAELVKKGAEIIVAPAAWCTLNEEKMHKTMLNNWKSLNISRAVDNAVYFISSNQCGKVDSMLSCVGYSSILAYDGEVLACAGENEGVAFAKIDIGALRDYRKIAPTKY